MMGAMLWGRRSVGSSIAFSRSVEEPLPSVISNREERGVPRFSRKQVPGFPYTGEPCKSLLVRKGRWYGIAPPSSPGVPERPDS
jgi:hypothetical protein